MRTTFLHLRQTLSDCVPARSQCEFPNAELVVLIVSVGCDRLLLHRPVLLEQVEKIVWNELVILVSIQA